MKVFRVTASPNNREALIYVADDKNRINDKVI